MKYKLSNKTKSVRGKTQTLYRIQALKDFGDVKKGDLGGFVQNETNLSQKGSCWIYDDACVFDNAQVYENARVSGNAWVYENAFVYENAAVFRDARVFGQAQVYGEAFCLWEHLVPWECSSL